jgi:hypothetical protein
MQLPRLSELRSICAPISVIEQCHVRGGNVTIRTREVAGNGVPMCERKRNLTVKITWHSSVSGRTCTVLSAVYLLMGVTRAAGRDRPKSSLCALVRTRRHYHRFCRHLSFVFRLSRADFGCTDMELVKQGINRMSDQRNQQKQQGGGPQKPAQQQQQQPKQKPAIGYSEINVRSAVRILLPRNGLSTCPIVAFGTCGRAMPADISLRIGYTCLRKRRRMYRRAR